MAVYEVFAHSEKRRYKTHIVSWATVLQIFCIALTFIVPWLIAFRSHGFWVRVDTYEEQGDIHFKHEVMVVLHTSTQGDYVSWSTYHNYNQLQMQHFRVPLLKSREDDENGDGKSDILYYQMDMPLLDSEQVYGVELLLIFDYKLYKYSSMRMESMAYISEHSSVAGASLEVVGDLKFHQREPLGYRGTDTRFNDSVIDSTSLFASAYDLNNIFESYSQRNASTYYAIQLPVWKSGRGAGQPFVIKATVRYPEETISYTPGFWQEIKNGWIQYLAFLLIFLFIFDRIKIFIFENQIVSTVVEYPFQKLKVQ